MDNQDRIKVNHYGDILASINNLEALYYKEYGSYQGDYLAINTDGNRLFIYIGYFGSCSGCDWIESERDWDDGTISYKSALDYCKDHKPYLILPRRKYTKREWEDILSTKYNEYDFNYTSEDLKIISEIS